MATKKTPRAGKGRAAAKGGAAPRGGAAAKGGAAKAGAAARKGGSAGKRRAPAARAPAAGPKKRRAEATPPGASSPHAAVEVGEVFATPMPAATPEVEPINITVRTKEGPSFNITSSRNLQRAAMHWTYVLRNRWRWATQDAVREKQSVRSQEQLKEFGVGEGELEQLAEAEVVEVSVPYRSEEVGWEARIFPWEYILTAATRKFRDGRPMTVVRHLDRRGADPAARPDPSKVLLVESAPAGLDNFFTFESERALVKSNLSPPAEYRETAVKNPTAEELRQEIVAYGPDVIHLTGADNHQATQLLDALKSGEPPQDGYLMRGERSQADLVSAERLAAVLNAAANRPALVSCNVYNSAARMTALIVAGGADAAIGFQDEFDDALTESFFTNFYHLWNLSGWHTLEAFKHTCNTLRARGGLYGTGVVLWSARTLVGPPPEAPRRRGQRRAAAPTRAENLDVLAQTQQGADILPERVEPGRAGEVLPIKIKPYESLNYSMLHNNRPLFESFLISKPQAGRVRGIRVRVVLYAGPTSFPYDLTLDIDQGPLDLKDKIRVPLIYSMGPTISESVHTSLYVNVTWGQHELYNETHRVTLLPLDEWRDDDNDRIWLPSFVLPRDRSVGRVLDAGQRYLMALADDSGAGFDGYQSVYKERDPATGKTVLNTDDVDLQVQALWAALSYEMNIGYINPPPSYNFSAQRVRTPTEIIEGHRGTCIDLALLMATCLEYIEVYPVVFLLEGHAFPGYWRSAEYHESFEEMATAGAVAEDAASPGQPQNPTGSAQHFPWYLDKTFYPEVIRQVRDRKLVPIESTMLTSRGGFGAAIDEGMKNLRSKREFHSLLDVRLARENRVTPIPLRGRHE